MSAEGLQPRPTNPAEMPSQPKGPDASPPAEVEKVVLETAAEANENAEPRVWLDRSDYNRYVRELRNETNPLNTGAFEVLRQEGIAINSGWIRVKFSETKDGTPEIFMLNTDLGDHFLELSPVDEFRPN